MGQHEFVFIFYCENEPAIRVKTIAIHSKIMEPHYLESVTQFQIPEPAVFAFWIHGRNGRFADGITKITNQRNVRIELIIDTAVVQSGQPAGFASRPSRKTERPGL